LGGVLVREKEEEEEEIVDAGKARAVEESSAARLKFLSRDWFWSWFLVVVEVVPSSVDGGRRLNKG